jgi:hypothetical protein
MGGFYFFSSWLVFKNYYLQFAPTDSMQLGCQSLPWSQQLQERKMN